MFNSPLHKDSRLPALYALHAKKHECQARISALKKRIQATHDVLQLEELKCRKRVLRRLGFTDSSDIVDMKGRVACEISTGDELLLTELIFNGVFNPLLPEQCAALLSCFVFTEKVCTLLYLQSSPGADDDVTERPHNHVEGRASRSLARDARDCKKNSESVQRIQTTGRGR